MPIYSTSSINFDYIKVRWQEPYVSNALNRKLFGLLPKGIYGGFTLGVGGLSNRDITINNGSVSGGLGTGLVTGYVSGGYDETVGFSIAIHHDTSGFSTTVSIPPATPAFHLDATGLNGQRVFAVIDAQYSVGVTTAANFYLVDGSQINAHPSYIVIGYCDVPSNPTTPIDLSLFGYNDVNFPRLTPIATSQKAGFMPASAFAQLSQFFVWQNLCAASIDQNSNFVIDISPSQFINASNNTRVYTYVLPNISSRFPRNSSGVYNGGVNNNSITTLNIQSGLIGGAHQITGNTNFAIPSVSGTASSFQVGLIALDAGDGLNVTYGSVFGSSALALLDSNLPATGSSLFQIAAFLVSTDVSGNILPISAGGLLDRRPFLNLGGGGSGGASSILVDYITEFQNSNYGYLNTCIFSSDGSTFVNNASTGALDLVTNEFAFSVSGQTLISNGNLSADFLSGGFDLTDVTLRTTWDTALTDTKASYFLSRDGGVDYQAVSMTQVDSGADFVGRLVFANTETISTLSSYVSGNINSTQQLNSTSGLYVAEPFTLSQAGVALQAQVFVNKVGSPAGSFTLNLIKDLAGVPSSAPSDTLAVGPQVLISSLPAGQSLVTSIFPAPTVLVAGNYHLAIETDTVYQASFVSGVTEIDAEINTGSPTAPNLMTFVSGAWTQQTGKALIYYVGGRSLDLRVKVVAGTAGVKLGAYAVEYSPNSQFITQKLQQQTVTVNGSLNTNSFTVSNFLPNPYTLKVYQVETGAVFVTGSFTVNGQNVVFPPNTFNLPGQTVTLIFDQTQGSAIDTSDANAANILTANTSLALLGSQMPAVLDTVTPLINVPFTTITNRANIVDPSNSLLVSRGVTRVLSSQITELQGETGPNGERIFGVLGDTYGLIRFGGNWVVQNGSNGTYINTSFASDFCEITFWGTGLNLFAFLTGSGFDTRATVDGGTEGANFIPYSGNSFPTLNQTKGFGTGSVINVSKGLTLGLHTIKLRNNGTNSTEIYGFEILNESSVLNIAPGGYYANASRYSLNSVQTLSSVSGFTAGTLGTTGGHAAIYLSATGLGSAVNPNAASPSYYPSASHTSEEIVETHYIREFGAGTANDFSLLLSGGTVGFSLSDGSTCLYGNTVTSAGLGSQNSYDAVYPGNSSGTKMWFWFVGTGLDLLYVTDGATGALFTIIIDGVTVTSTFSPGAATFSAQTLKIASGLPYGSHYVKVNYTSGSGGHFGFLRFITYQTKIPAIPLNSVLLADYNVLSNYVATVSDPQTSISNGVILKTCAREFTYNGTWGAGFAQGSGVMSGHGAATATTNDTVLYTFWGTGIEIYGSLRSALATLTVQIDGVNYTGAAVIAGNGSWTAGTATWTITTAGSQQCTLQITGLALAVHTVQVTNTTTNGWQFNGMGLITPTHIAKMSQYTLGNNLSIDSQSVSDARNPGLFPTPAKAWAQAVGVVVTPTTTSSTLIPIPDMFLTIKTLGGPIEITWAITVNDSVSGEDVFMQAFVDSQAVGTNTRVANTTAYDSTANGFVIVPVQAGTHTVAIYGRGGGGTVTYNNIHRILKVREEF